MHSIIIWNISPIIITTLANSQLGSFWPLSWRSELHNIRIIYRELFEDATAPLFNEDPKKIVNDYIFKVYEQSKAFERVIYIYIYISVYDPNLLYISPMQ